ncbi:hypothetical protein [Methylobacterium organophilum]|uniref:DUF2336 domain-containing protein n=1 Tax=Methylobacterium organophilum TaxID=410 RepID=A0ABQ4TC52_METOR|nr:hypothetical protein [Methylobacterium organophilum]GJE28619.1 hypothetical protein LKMONMHP_3492 [Methylobacterium organophilum]
MPLREDAAPDLSGLIELSRDPALDLKPVVLRVQTDLFVAAPHRDRVTLQSFSALATGLIPIVDEETALIVAHKLRACPDTPETVLEALAARGGAIRDAVRAPAPGAQPAAPAAKAGGNAAPAADVAADLALLEDPGRLLRGTSLNRMIARARRDGALARRLLARAELPPAELAPLFLHADPSMRAAMRDAVAMTAGLRPAPAAPRDLGPRLTAASEEKDVATFVATLAESLGIQKTFLAAAPDAQGRYDLLTLCLRAAGLTEEEAVFVFLTLNEAVAQSVERVFALTELFRSTSRAAARDLVSAILDQPLPERTGGEHVPYHGPESAKSRGAAPAAERAPVRTTLPSRPRRTV